MEAAKPERVEVTDYRSAVRSLTDWRYLRSEDWRSFKGLETDLKCCVIREGKKEGQLNNLAVFVLKLLRRAAKVGIPLACVSASYDVAFIVHARRRRELCEREWEVLAHMGETLSSQYHLRVHWGGPRMASCWMSEARASTPF